MKTIAKILIIIWCLTTVVSCVNIKNPPSDITFKTFGDYLDNVIPELIGNEIPGIQVALIENGETIYEKGFGFADKNMKIPITKDTIFQVASISKSVTAWGILSLAQNKKIDLDKPISYYLHRWQLPPSKYNSNDVTIRSILAHRAGLSLHAYLGYAPGERIPTIEQSLSGENSKILGLFGSGAVHIRQQPGKEFYYSGGGYTLLQLLIEEVTGESFSNFMKYTVFERAGMKSSNFEFNKDVEKRISKAYNNFGMQLPNYLFVEKAAAGLYTTAGDLACLLNELYRIKNDTVYKSSLLSQQWTSLFYTENSISNSGDDVFGYFREKKDGKIAIIEHRGGNRGWKCIYTMELQNGKGIVFLTNSDAGSDSVEKILDIFKKCIARK